MPLGSVAKRFGRIAHSDFPFLAGLTRAGGPAPAGREFLDRPRGPPAWPAAPQSVPGSLSQLPDTQTSNPQQSQSLLQEPSPGRQHRGTPPHSGAASSAQAICSSSWQH